MRRRRLATAARVAVVVAAAGLTAALAVAAVAAGRVAAANGYWDAGFHRLIATILWKRWDAWATGVLAAAVATGLFVNRTRPGRRTVLGAGALLVTVLGLRALAFLDAWRAADGPNLLLVSIDTLRADRLGAYGYALPTSPAIDRRLAAEGVVFEEVWSQSPKTTPSHMTMLTSLYPSVHGVELWDGTAPGQALRPAVHTLAEVLRNAGYATGAFTGGGYLEPTWGFHQGFEAYEACYGEELGRARRWLRRHAGRKFFLFFHTYRVHDPYLPPLATADLFDPEYRGPVRDVVRRLRNDPTVWDEAHRIFWDAVDRDDPRTVRYVERLYDAGIRDMDTTMLAPLLDHLAALGLERDTLVVLTSDHGEAFLEHGIFMHDDLHRETLRVPLVLRFPGRLPAGTRVRRPARLVDLMPTILELLGVPAPAALQGRSLAPLARGEAATDPPPEIVSEYSSTASGRVYESLRQGGATYIVDGGAESLFEDPGEHQNRAAARPDAVAAARAALERWRVESRALAARLGPPGETVVPQNESVRRLRALGYVQ